MLTNTADQRVELLRKAVEKVAQGNATEFGRMAGYKDGAFIRQMVAGDRPITEKTIERLENIHGLKGWFSPSTQGPIPNVAPAPSLRPPGLIPVVGHVKGGDDGYLEEMQFPVGAGEGFVEYWTRDSSAFALRVKGDSMHPRYRAGEFVVVTPHQEAQPGQDVVVKLTNGKKLLKQLNWLRNGEVQLLSINNHYGPMTLSLTEVESIQRVAGSVPSDAFIEP